MLILDPRKGDAEADQSSPMNRSLFAIAGSLLIEISPLKLIGAVLGLVVAPALLLGAVPLAGGAWASRLANRIDPSEGLWAIAAIIGLAAIAYGVWRYLFWAVEASFWSMNALLVQPVYTLIREGLRQLTDAAAQAGAAGPLNVRRRALMALAAGLLAAGGGIALALVVWPQTRWSAGAADLLTPSRLVWPALTNAVFLVAAYMAGASIAWGVADATMPQAQGLEAFDRPAAGLPVLRVAHLSDVHVVGDRFGFRLESGRLGPRGNERLRAAMAELARLHADRPIDLVLVTGDMTDAGKSSEWAEFLEIIEAHPALAARLLILPGNHDLNIIDAGNPARLEWPLGPARRLRRLRLLSAMVALHGDRIRIVDPRTGALDLTLSAFAAGHATAMRDFADRPSIRRAPEIDRIYRGAFPQVLPPAEPSGVGVILLDSNAETHFSFTNALGMAQRDDIRAIRQVMERYPDACWLLGLHHHITEYPGRASMLSERIGTALINGSWFARSLQIGGERLVALHGHRHKDWIGRCGSLKIVSAPSPVMGGTDDKASSFYIHNLQSGPDGLKLLPPERIVLTPPTRDGAAEGKDRARMKVRT